MTHEPTNFSDTQKYFSEKTIVMQILYFVVSFKNVRCKEETSLVLRIKKNLFTFFYIINEIPYYKSSQYGNIYLLTALTPDNC